MRRAAKTSVFDRERARIRKSESEKKKIEDKGDKQTKWKKVGDDKVNE